ncbi:flagellar basal body rod C-terminal domain-containing protein [Clostridium butyricum]|uniref:flagellar basal body rod C-terminal domain-containing protein n=1 Tax=Clostridium butyricum TaxID=1492 RepID=UPI0023EA64EC|nr:flagellar basal body rod C-terminal domain-containing protein [Clostridium butyricum]
MIGNNIANISNKSFKASSARISDMITAIRAFQVSSKMTNTADEILQTVTGLMR